MQVSQLSSNLEKTKARLEDEHCEKDRLLSEVSSLQTCLAHQRSTLEEARQQSTSLNTTIATLAEEKADVLREKVTLDVQVGTLQDSLESLRRRSEAVAVGRDRLQERVTECERRVFLAELNRSVTSQDAVISPRETSPTVSISSLKETLSTLLPPSTTSDEQDFAEKLVKEYEPLCVTLNRMKKREEELLGQLERASDEHDTRVKSLQEAWASETADLRKHHEETEVVLRGEAETLRERLREQQQRTESQLRKTRSEAAREMEVELATRCKQWERDMADLRSELECEKKGTEKAEQELKRQLETLATCQTELAEVHRERESLKEDNSLLLRDREQLTLTVAEVEDRRQVVEQSLDTAMVELEQHQVKVRELEGEVERLGQNQLQMEQRMREDGQTLVGVRAQLVESQKRSGELLREKESFESALLAAQEERSSLEGKLLAIKAELSSVIAQLETSQLSHTTAQTNYSSLLASIEQALAVERPTNPLHSGEDSKISSPDDVCGVILELKNERDTLVEATTQNRQNLEQFRKRFEHATQEKSKAESHIQSLQSSLESLTRRYDAVSQQHSTLQTTSQAAKESIDRLERERKELRLANEALQKQMRSNSADMQNKCVRLKERVKEAESVSKERREEALQLRNMVTVLKSSLVNRERAMGELEERLQSTQRDMLQREMTHKKMERERLGAERRLAVFEQDSLKHENTKRELQSRVQYLESQLREIHKKTTMIRRELSQAQSEKELLARDVERLSQCLKTTTQEKQSLTRSLEGEIERLRGEVERHLHENSALKLELVHNSSIYTQN